GRMGGRGNTGGGGHAGLLLEWIESNGPACPSPSQAGYGTRAIRSLIPYELNGTVDLAFESDGVRCKIALPCKCICDPDRPADGTKNSAAGYLSVARLSAAQSR